MRFLLVVALGIVRCGFPAVFKTLTGPYRTVLFGRAMRFLPIKKRRPRVREPYLSLILWAASADNSRNTSRQSRAREATNRRHRPARTGDETDTRPQVVALRARAPVIVAGQPPSCLADQHSRVVSEHGTPSAAVARS